MHHTTPRIIPHAIPTSCGIKKNCSPNKTMWLIAFAGELGPLPHGILDTSEDTQVRGFPQKSGLVCAWTFLYLSRSVAGARGVQFRREPTSLTFLRGKYERKLFLKSWKLFLKFQKLFLKSQILFLKSQKLFLKSWELFLKSWKLFLKYFLNPRNYFLIWAPNPKTIYKTRIAFTNPNHWTRIAVNHLKSRDCPRQVSHVLTEKERLQAPFILFRSMFILFRSMFFDSSSQNQSLFLSYFSICKEFQYVIMCLYVSIFVNLGFIFFLGILSCLMI